MPWGRVMGTLVLGMGLGSHLKECRKLSEGNVGALPTTLSCNFPVSERDTALHSSELQLG